MQSVRALTMIFRHFTRKLQSLDRNAWVWFLSSLLTWLVTFCLADAEANLKPPLFVKSLFFVQSLISYLSCSFDDFPSCLMHSNRSLVVLVPELMSLL